MNLIKSDSNVVQIELTRDEFSLLTSIIFTADTEFENLDAAIYQIDEKAVSEFAAKISGIQKTVIEPFKTSK